MNEHTTPEPEDTEKAMSYVENLEKMAGYAEVQVEILEEEERVYLAERDNEEKPLWHRQMASRALRCVRTDLVGMKQVAKEQREQLERARGTWQEPKEANW